jgi:hypothetical protein
VKFARPLNGFQADIDDLRDESAARMAVLQLKSVALGQLTGEPLNKRASTGDLSDCFKLYFDPVGGQKPRFRLVYRIVVVPGGEQRVQPVSVGLRGDLDAYLRAARNLGRI